ncbi:hypothetical protein SAMN06265375_10131 [Muriicola jejuensis]|uniref:Uncharacterized protein n=1 Tax=Muriicola jejuensis TaxID=504488 RepID=A0A6P0UAU6_9FLAO|nr:hypothetical protein [Muriicola jejuensis]NER10421.1 hypothetical protein [Muriicola jejuensis]SMP00869.1 hypothetical protein SAMN06265375_10131 [Muriicola jejuensis]
MKISKRDIKFFLFGALTMFLIVLIYEWDDFKRGFKDGFEKGRAQQEVTE